MICEKVLLDSKFWSQKKQDSSLKLRALDLGCAVGRTTFDFSRLFDKAIGIDFSHRFVQAADTLKHHKQILYKIPQEGQICLY